MDGGLIMKMKILLLLSVFVAFSSFYMLEPTAAAQKGYLIDQGYQICSAGMGEAPDSMKITWKTYWYSKNTRQTIKIVYLKEAGKWKFHDKEILTLQKISKNTIKIKEQGEWGTTYDYIKTKRSTRDYYWKIFRNKYIKR